MGKANQLFKHKRLIKKYLSQGLNYKAIFLLLKDKLEYKMTYFGLRVWIMNNLKDCISHEKHNKDSKNKNV